MIADRRSGTQWLAWVTLAWNLAVILLGALVRATGSGAGCGASWPACDGVVVPELKGATAIEFSHRAASGIALVLIAWLVVRVFRTSERGEPARKSVGLAGFGIISESLIGAGIVLFELVADDASLARAIAVPIHLVNTFVLLAGLTLTAYLADGDRRILAASPHRRAIVGFGLGMMLIAATGAITALADTLFPAESLTTGFADDFSSTTELLTRLRVFHPVLAILVGVGAARWVSANGLRLPGSAGTAARVVVTVVFIQLIVGVVNVWALTPLLIQMLHLLLADLLWIAWVWLGAEMLTIGARSTVSVE